MGTGDTIARRQHVAAEFEQHGLSLRDLYHRVLLAKGLRRALRARWQDQDTAQTLARWEDVKPVYAHIAKALALTSNRDVPIDCVAGLLDAKFALDRLRHPAVAEPLYGAERAHARAVRRRDQLALKITRDADLGTYIQRLIWQWIFPKLRPVRGRDSLASHLTAEYFNLRFPTFPPTTKAKVRQLMAKRKQIVKSRRSAAA